MSKICFFSHWPSFFLKKTCLGTPKFAKKCKFILLRLENIAYFKITSSRFWMLGAASAALPSTWQLGTGRSSTGWVSSGSILMSVLSDSPKICSEKVDCCFQSSYVCMFFLVLFRHLINFTLHVRAKKYLERCSIQANCGKQTVFLPSFQTSPPT